MTWISLLHYDNGRNVRSWMCDTAFILKLEPLGSGFGISTIGANFKITSPSGWLTEALPLVPDLYECLG